MNKVKFFFTLSFVFSLLAATPADARKWTLQECLDYAMTHNVTAQ
ncbi:hypothetical protein [Prevotella melaninogenica]